MLALAGLLAAGTGRFAAVQAAADANPPDVVACGAAAPGADLEVQEPGRVQVLCPSVERVANRPIRMRSDCRLLAGTWTCQPRDKQLVLAVNGRRVAVDFPLAQNSWSAYQMLQAIGPMTVPLDRPESRRPREHEERCVLSGDDGDAQVARMTLACSVWTVEFVKLCGAAGCRYEPAVRRGSDPPRARDRKRSSPDARPAG